MSRSINFRPAGEQEIKRALIESCSSERSRYLSGSRDSYVCGAKQVHLLAQFMKVPIQSGRRTCHKVNQSVGVDFFMFSRDIVVAARPRKHSTISNASSKDTGEKMEICVPNCELGCCRNDPPGATRLSASAGKIFTSFLIGQPVVVADLSCKTSFFSSTI